MLHCIEVEDERVVDGTGAGGGQVVQFQYSVGEEAASVHLVTVQLAADVAIGIQ